MWEIVPIPIESINQEVQNIECNAVIITLDDTTSDGVVVNQEHPGGGLVPVIKNEIIEQHIYSPEGSDAGKTLIEESINEIIEKMMSLYSNQEFDDCEETQEFKGWNRKLSSSENIKGRNQIPCPSEEFRGWSNIICDESKKYLNQEKLQGETGFLTRTSIELEEEIIGPLNHNDQSNVTELKESNILFNTNVQSNSLSPTSIPQICCICKKTLLYTTNVGNILQCDSSGSQFKCNVCKCLFSSAEDLKVHMKIHIERINSPEKNDLISENGIAIEKNNTHILKELIVKVKRLEDNMVKHLSNKKIIESKTPKTANIQLTENNIDFVNMPQKTSVKATQTDNLSTVVNHGDETEKESIRISEQKSYTSNNKEINQSIQKLRHSDENLANNKFEILSKTVILKNSSNVRYTKLKVGQDSESIKSPKKLKMKQHNKFKSSTTMSNELDIKYNNVHKMYKNHNIMSDQEETDLDTNRLENIESELNSMRDVHQKSKDNHKNSFCMKDNLPFIQTDEKTNSSPKMSIEDEIKVDNNIYKICKNQKSKICKKYEIKQMEEISIDKNTLLRTNEEADKIMNIIGICDEEERKLQKLSIKSLKRYKCQLCNFKSASEDCLTQHSKVHICKRTKMCRDKTNITSDKPKGSINQNIDVFKLSRSKPTLLVSNAMENIANNNLLHDKNDREQADGGKNLNKKESSRMHKKSKMDVLEVPCNKNNILGAIPLENDMTKQLSVNSEVVEREKLKKCKLSNTNKKQYKCILCNFKSSSYKILIHHGKVHNCKKIKTVNDVDTKSNKTSSENTKKISQFNNKIKRIHNCESCDITFLSAEILKRHKASHKTHQVYNCNICDFYCARLTSLKLHLHTHSNEKPYKCKLCPYKCARPDILRVHKRKHQGDKPYKCKICGCDFTQSCALKVHSRIHTGERPYKCEICDFKSTQLSGLKSHMDTHTKIKPYKCRVCKYACSRPHTLKVHSRVHTGERPYQCSLCDYSASFSVCLKQHMYVHMGDKPFKCTLCSYASPQNEALNVHMRTHTGEKPFKCKHCDFRCSRKSSLKLHNRIHTGEKPYHCNVCQYTASRLETLRVHIRVHTGERPFLCSTCGSKFSQQSALNIHNRIHTGERPYKCMTCGFCSVTSSELKKHIMRIHEKHLYLN